jgi:hypothetical protein
MASTDDESAKRPRLSDHRGADAERGEDPSEPLQDEELEEEEGESGAEGGHVPDAAAEDAEGGDEPGAAAEDLAPDGW